MTGMLRASIKTAKPKFMASLFLFLSYSYAVAFTVTSYFGVVSVMISLFINL